MILVVGGYGAGKRDWVAQTLGYGPDQMAPVGNTAPVVYGLEAHAAKYLKDCSPLLEKQVVICCETGCGVVPADAAGRAAREATGRLCQQLAARADCVVQVVCGVGRCIKGKLPC